MGSLRITEQTNTAYTVEIDRVTPGAIVTALRSNPESYYGKVAHDKMGVGVSVAIDHCRHPKNTKVCVLYNVKSGTLRAVKADERVEVVAGEFKPEVLTVRQAFDEGLLRW